jgi:predicted N-acetyltransferase YhbS
MKVETIPEVRLTPAQDAEIAALLARCFTTDFGGRSYFQQRHHLRLVARDPGLVGHVALTLRAIRAGGVLTDIAGLAEVATDPAHRGKGIAATLLQAAIAEAKASPAQFQSVHNPITWIDLTGARMGTVHSERAQSLMVLPLRDKEWDAIAPLDLMGNLF